MHSLVLHCSDPCWRPAHASDVADVLARLGLTGAARPDVPGLYAAGDAFLSLVTFLGCAPQISLTEADAREGQPVCRVRLHRFDTTTLLASAPPPAPRCPSCRAGVCVPPEAPFDGEIGCAGCGEEHLLHRLDWRRGAGFGRCFVEVENVYPHEAVPAEVLLERLAELSAVRWDYFYLSR